MVNESSCRLKEGIDNKSGKTAVKYSVAFDGILPCLSETFTESKYGSEDITLPVVVKNHLKQDTDHCNIYVLDRGLQSTRNMKGFSDESIYFIVRAKENSKYVELASSIYQHVDTDLGFLTLIKDSIVNLYTGVPIMTKKEQFAIKRCWSKSRSD